MNQYAIYGVYLKNDLHLHMPDYYIVAPATPEGFEAAFREALSKHGAKLHSVDVERKKVGAILNG